MSRTTFQIGADLQSRYPNKTIEHIRNFAIKGGTDTTIAGVMVRYDVGDTIVHWCYI